MRKQVEQVVVVLMVLLCMGALVPLGAVEAAKVTVAWDKTLRVSRTNATVMMSVNPMMRRDSPIHDQVFKALHDLGADYVCHLGWVPYPRLAVAELAPPREGKTFWDFSALDPIMVDFLEATKGHPVLLNFSTIPQWMFKTPKPVAYPEDPYQAVWNYEQGTELRDPSLKELAEYYARLAGWYMKGGFTDEYGKWHESGHHFQVAYWGVLNEIDIEHPSSPQVYTARYDAIVRAVRSVAPRMKFVGLMLALPNAHWAQANGFAPANPQYFEYFLNPKNHQPGIPLDMIAYHFYVLPAADETPALDHQFTYYAMADSFVDEVRYIDAIRQRHTPHTGTMINELGVILPEDFAEGTPGYVYKPTEEAYRNRYGALYAYLFAELTHLGIEVVAESNLLSFPTEVPSTTMLDWQTGQPNAAYWVLKLVRDNFGPGDRVVDAKVEMPGAYPGPYVSATGFVKPDGARKILLINKRERAFEISIPGASGASVQMVDPSTNSHPAASSRLSKESFTLEGMGVAVVTLP